jgi:hypothetical protein
MNVFIVVVNGSKDNSSRAQPNFGCIIRSPSLVESNIFRLLCMSSSASSITTDPVVLLNSGGKLQPLPKNELLFAIFYPPIKTVASPRIIVPPCAVESPIRAAGIPFIRTVAEPAIILSGGPEQVAISPTRAAGKPPISTSVLPGGRIGPPT